MSGCAGNVMDRAGCGGTCQTVPSGMVNVWAGVFAISRARAGCCEGTVGVVCNEALEGIELMSPLQTLVGLRSIMADCGFAALRVASIWGSLGIVVNSSQGTGDSREADVNSPVLGST